MHSNGEDVAILQEEEVYQTLAALKQEGKSGGFGFSGKTAEGGILGLKQGDCAMVTYNLNERDELPVIDYAAQHNKGILIKKALASGHICLADGVDPVQASFAMIFAHPAVTSAIVGTITPKNLQANVECIAQILRAAR